jgi:serine/threonine protein kinase/tetratricopeptide (TPR) repeat protein
MPTPQTPESSREEQLNEILLAYVEAAEEGRAPDRWQFVAEHPDFAADLAEFFAGRDRLERLAAPIREVARSTSARGNGFDSSAGGNGNLAGTRRPAGAELPPPGNDSTERGSPSALGELGDFRLLREIGRGGMGIVYEAVQISLNRPVALKVLSFAAALDPKQLHRFKNEAQAAAQLHHTNIVPVHAVGCERGVHYYAMQLIDGKSVAAMIAELRQLARFNADGQADWRHASILANELVHGHVAVSHSTTPDPDQTGPYSPPKDPPQGHPEETVSQPAAALSTERSIKSRRFFHRVAHLGMKAAEALEHAHQLGVVHRDIKPANLLVDVRGNLWITDFGLALFQSDGALTLTGELLGTLRYMSPEQASAKRGLVDHRTDIYSLGITLYELLTLEHAFTGADRHELLHQVAFAEPRQPRSIDRTIPVELETIVLKAVAKNPVDRYLSAQEMADDLQRFLDDKPIMARRPTLMEKATKWARRHRSLVTSAVALALVLTAGSLFSTYWIAQEQAKTQAALDREKERSLEATQQRALAETSFRQAREAVDFFTRIAEEERGDKPELVELRRRLLLASLDYYQSFIVLRRDDPDTRAELAVSLSRVGKLLVELGAKGQALEVLDRAVQLHEKLVRENPEDPEHRRNLAVTLNNLFALQGCQLFTLLYQRDVQMDLGLSEEQKQKIAQMASKLEDQRRAFGETRNLEPEVKRQRNKEMKKAFSENEKAFFELVTPAQRERLWQLSYQFRGPYAFFRDPDVADALRLTKEQTDQIQSIMGERVRQPRDLLLPGDHHSRERHDKVRKDAEEFRKAAFQKILALLTTEQRSTWDQMIGSPFEGEMRHGPWGGPGPYPSGPRPPGPRPRPN